MKSSIGQMCNFQIWI